MSTTYGENVFWIQITLYFFACGFGKNLAANFIDIVFHS